MGAFDIADPQYMFVNWDKGDEVFEEEKGKAYQLC